MTREMTREEVVQRLTNDWFISLGGQLCVDGDKKEGFLEAIGFAIKELQEPERKRGRWIRQPEPPDPRQSFAKCSVCGYPVELMYKTKFCPNCGADMRGEEK